MPRYFAFLRAINVGGHTVKMDQLKRTFEELGYSEVSTFIASGNVVFQTEIADAAAIEAQIEDHLRQRLGYTVATFLRTSEELARIATLDPFELSPAGERETLYVGFLATTPAAAARDRLLALGSDDDRLHVDGREIYWLRRGSFMDSPLGGGAFEKALGNMPTTVRNVSTVRRLAAKYPARARPHGAAGAESNDPGAALR